MPASQETNSTFFVCGGLQEEIRFSTCPELIAAMLFMENMEENEAIVITGFEQFSTCTGYAATLEFAGPFYDKAEVAEDDSFFPLTILRLCCSLCSMQQCVCVCVCVCVGMG